MKTCREPVVLQHQLHILEYPPAASSAPSGRLHDRERPPLLRVLIQAHLAHEPSAIAAEEEVTKSLPTEEGEPASAAVFLTVMLEVAPLAERHQVTRAIVGWVVVAVSRCEHHARGPHMREGVRYLSASHPSPLPVPPGSAIRVPPAAITKVADDVSMWPTTALAAALRPLEADHGRELLPVDGVEPTVLRTDRH
jgi:hypothetical protein